MKRLYIVLFFVLIFYPFIGKAQTTYLPLHSAEEHLLNRLETKSGVLSPYFFGWRPISRKDAMYYIKSLRVPILHGDVLLTRRDKYDIKRAESISSEWVETADGLDGAIPSKTPILKFLYLVQPDAIHIHTDNFFLAVNPVIDAELIKENNVHKIGYINTRGIELRGRIAKKIGFYTMLADNQERPMSYVHDYERMYHAFPGVSSYNYKNNGNYNIFLTRGYVDADFIHEHLNVTFGYDKNFSGVGVRSLIQSDFGPPATFLRLRAHWGRFGYQTLLMDLTASLGLDVSDNYIYDHKYAAIHQLGFRARPWLNIGVFESTMFAGVNHLKATDLIPVIGYQTIAQAAGAHQKTALGLWFKALAVKKFQFYGQAYLGRLNLSEIGQGYWGNQVGLQVGGKYFDAFGAANLDLQGELNLVRPFTYSGNGDNTDYTHYRQPLAEPYGAGFAEIIGDIKYQPLNKLYVSAKAIFSLRGTDADSTENNGVNLLKNANLRQSDYGYSWIPGAHRKGLYLNLNIDYEIRPNIFIEVGATNWNWQYQSNTTHATSLYGGLRWNISRRAYDSY